MKRSWRHGCDWTREEDLLLTREWGEISGELLAQKLGRSQGACIRQARALGLPCAVESAGRESIKALGVRLGLSGWAVLRLLRECGWAVRPLALVTQSTRRRQPKRGADPAVAELLCTLRTTRVCSLHQWDLERGVRDGALRLLLAAGLPRPLRRGLALRVPIALLDELAAGIVGGPWAVLWRRVTSMDGRPCVAWFLALATADILRGNGEWTEWAAPPAVMHAARELAGLTATPCVERAA